MSAHEQILWEFCNGEPLWNASAIYKTRPEFSRCLLDTVLVWVPCGYMWIAAPFFALYLKLQDDAAPLPISTLSASKSIISLLLILFVGIQLVLRYHSSPASCVGMTISPAFHSACALKTLTLLLCIFLQQFQRHRGVKTSAVPFTFWMLLIMTEIPSLYTYIVRQDAAICSEALIYYIFYSLVVLQFVLHCFAEKYWHRDYEEIRRQNPCPEENASVLSRVTHQWFSPIVWKAFKKTLNAKEFWDQTTSLKSENVGPRLEQVWEEEVKRCQQEGNRSKFLYANGFLHSDHYNLRRVNQNGIHLVHSTDSLQNTTKSSSLHSLHSNISGYGTTNSESKENGIPSRALADFLASENSPLIPVYEKSKDNHDVKCQPNLYKTLTKVFWKFWVEAVLYMSITQVLWFLQPFVLGYIVQFIQKKHISSSLEDPAWLGYIYCVILLLLMVGNSFMHHVSYKHMLSLGQAAKTALMSLIFRKALKMKRSCGQQSTVGEIVNHMSVDCQRIQDAFVFSSFIVLLFVITGLAVLQLWGLMGIAALGSMIVFLIILPIVGYIGIRQYTLQKELLSFKGTRIKILNEAVCGIKVLKMYGWEPSFMHKIENIRMEEVKRLFKFAWMSAISVVLAVHSPFMMNFALIAIYVQSSPNHSFHASEAFTALSVVNIMRFAVALFPNLVNAAVQAYNSIGRIQEFLRTPDLAKDNVQFVKDSDYAISIENGDFTWTDDSSDPTLKDINLQVYEGELVAVVGQVGSGKSSLISACLGEMERCRGQTKIKGSVAYVPQEAWIQNMKLKENILFGKEYRQKKYSQVIEACALQPDLNILPGGDETEIGERGINISGGQKQRVSLARAVYSNSDIYLLDDPLSAVDSHVGKHIFQHVIGKEGLLRNKTRILVTHGVHWLPMVDRIVVLVDGKISEIGSYKELISHDGPFALFLQQYLQKEDGDEGDSDPEIEEMIEKIRHQIDDLRSDGGLTTDDEHLARYGCVCRRKRRRKDAALEMSASMTRSSKMNDASRLTQEEFTEEGAVKLSIVLNFIKAMGVGSFVIFLVSMGIYTGLNMYSNFWLSFWTEHNDRKARSNVTKLDLTVEKDSYVYYLLMYLLQGVFQGFFLSLAFYLVLTRMAKASGQLHKVMLCNVIRSPASFFDTTPTGRIMNRFSSDIDIMDNNLPNSVRLFTIMGLLIVAITIVVSIMTPLFIAILVGMGIIYYLLVRYYLPTARLMRRLDSIRRSPIYNHFSEAITGASVIRAYRSESRFMGEFRSRVDNNTKFFYAAQIGSRWIGVRIENLGNLIVLLANILTIASGLSGAEVGLSISYAIQITITMNLAVVAVSDLEMDIVSVERVSEYMELPKEAGHMLVVKKPPQQWPRTGKIEFQDYWTRYRKGLDLVLRGITFTIKSGEKVGVVGRTGAGKSSLTLSLFRMLEAAGGKILVDGVDISELDLHTLRTSLTILPQDPVIFSGTLRSNLDPFNCYNDESIWHAIECAHLKKFVQGLEQGLNYECGEGGQNLSVGQRQLVCLARTLLHKTKILVLDEATAAVDIETDELIQETIRLQFKDCTVLTIAHRLHTIMDYDKIIVMAAGQIKEMDSPQVLLQNSDGVFFSMAREAGLV